MEQSEVQGNETLLIKQLFALPLLCSKYDILCNILDQHAALPSISIDRRLEMENYTVFIRDSRENKPNAC